MMLRGTAMAREARPLRFLLLCVGGWTVLRVAAHWSPQVPAPAVPAPPLRLAPPPTVPVVAWSSDPAAPTHGREGATGQAWMTGRSAAMAARDGVARTTGLSVERPVGDSGGADRHGLRAALIARLFPERPGGAIQSAMRNSRADWYPVAAAQQAPPGQGKPFWMRRQMAGWSLGGWLYLRDGGRAAPDGIAAAGQLGGSQAGLRLAYGLGDSGRTRVYGRATLAVQRIQQREVAFGLAIAPVARWPVDLAVEQRLAAGRDGRTALAAMVTGGVGDVTLPHDFRLEAYAQAGIVGARRRDGFADGAVVVDRRVGPDEATPVRFGALAAGAVQPGAARLDVGPRVTVRLPQVGEGSRIALDWRQRVAGDAQPESGLALTLATDF
ncbi:hypothetical protein [Sphingopyxis solisilvae]|uniref:hypothetical protein n=1 Tax=Sphingopyxis solisilvae TaxID=1886788 RepID=UPI0018929E14|nr:hypothetical protein [Sphingopyxis solisilvae]